MEPKDTKAVVGEKTVLQCSPPKGTPDPIVHWRRNGEIINLETFERMRIVDGGSLQISNAQPTDNGKYQCVAHNLVGTRYSDIVTLSVHRKPYVLASPQDVITLAGEAVDFHCRVGGEPFPRVLWRRDDGRLPVGRARLLEDRSLRIEHVQPIDGGVYICEAENDVGAVSVKASLTVHAPPEFVRYPKDQKVGLNSVAHFECGVTGYPAPTLFWNREGSQELMFPGHNYGAMTVDEGGMLSIQAVQREDSGYFVCSAVSVAGSVSSRSFLQVLSREDVPPPLIELGPMNQSTPMYGEVLLPCQARGVPLPDIQWYKDGSPLHRNLRTNIWDNGTLHITELQLSDSGLYTCTASTESGESSWSAIVTVDASTANVTREPPPVPPPSLSAPPIVSNASQTSLSVSWFAPNHPFITGYTIEYYSPDLQTGWVAVERGWNSTNIEVTDLKPDTEYMFVVRVESAGGLSLPSEVSAVAHTLPEASAKLAEARAHLTKGPIISLTRLQAISSSAVTLSWKIHGSKEYMEGLYIRYRKLMDRSEEFELATFSNINASSHTLTKLRKYSKYEVFLVPFYKSIAGQPSNSMEVETLEDVPSSPPDHLQVAWVNATSAFVHWSPPPPQHCNGQLLGYELLVQDGSNSLVRSLRLNASAMSVLINNLTQGHVYTASLKAFTRMGLGPAAQVRSVQGPDAYLSLPPQQFWLVLVAAAAAVVLVSAVAAALYLRRRNGLTKQIGHISAVNASDLPHLGLMGGVKEALWIEVPQVPQVPCKQVTLEGSDYAEVDAMSFYGGRKDPALTPYATTVLVPNTRHDSGSETGPLIVPVSNSSSGTKTSTSGDSWLRHHPTLEARDDERACLQCSGPPIWTEFLPPPPQHPPPPRPQDSHNRRSCGSPPMSKKSLGSCSQHSRDSNLGYSQCWQASQVPSFPSGYHTGSSNISSFKCRQTAQANQSQDNTLCSHHNGHSHRHELARCSCCCHSVERNNHRHIHTVSGEVEEGSYSSISCSCSEETASCTKDC